jgi:hypothetical protein
LRPHWKCLQDLNDNSQMKLSDYLDKWDKEYRLDSILFYNPDKKPVDGFELTGFYPSFTQEETALLDVEIKNLISNTNLDVPHTRTCHLTNLLDESSSTNMIHTNETNINELVDGICLKKVGFFIIFF